MRYDFVGIREFAEMLTREGGLASGRVLSNRKALEGARLHRHVQKKLTAEHADFQADKAALYTVNREWLTDSDAAYLSSKSVDIASEPAGFMLEGRIDGVYTDNDTLVICEIKSGDEHPASASAAHFLQAAVYAFIESRDLPSDAKLRIDIIYGLYSDYDALRVFSFAETPESIAAIFRPYAFRYGRYVRFNIDHNARLSRQLDELPFLFDSFRDGQRRLSVNVFNTLNNSEGGTLLCKAPTGIGKTAGTLYPALKALRFADGEKSAVFYFTARGEGARPPAEALKLAGSQATELRYCVLTAKDKICLNTTSGSEKNASREFECKPEQCEAGKGHYDRVDAAIREALFSNARCFDSRFVSELARKHCVCPFELMLDLSQFCDVIVCDYNYLFDPESYLRRYFEGKGGQYFFLIDEAHQLPDRVRSMYSATLDAHTFARLAKGKKRQRIGKSCVKTAQALEALLCAPAPGDTFDEPAQLELFEQGTDPVSKVPARNDAASDGAAADETDSKTTFLVDKSLLRQLESFCDAAAE